MSSVLASCIDQANPPEWKGRVVWKAGSQQLVFCLSGKTCSPVVSAHTLLGANILVLVKELMLLTAVPGRVRTNYKLTWAVKCSVFP